MVMMVSAMQDTIDERSPHISSMNVDVDDD